MTPHVEDPDAYCRSESSKYTNLVYDYVRIRGTVPGNRIGDCMGHNVNPQTGYVGETFYFFVYVREHCPSGYGHGWQPVPQQCARVLPECPYPKEENSVTHVCEEPVCPPGSKLKPDGSACVPRISPKPPNAPPPPSCPLPKDLPAGNPIYPLRGVKREVVALGERIGQLSFQLTYDTTLRLPRGDGGINSVEPGVLGGGWFSNLHRKIIVEGRGEVVQAERGDGYRVTFSTSGSTFTPNADHLDRLFSDGNGGFRYIDASTKAQESYNASGRLIAIHWIQGSSLALSYSDANTPAADAPAPGYLLQVQDQTGRNLRFRYNTNGQLVKVLDVAGQSIDLAYASQGLVNRITWPDANSRAFLYGDSRHFWAMTNAQNEYNNTSAAFGYDDVGRAISTEQSGGVNRYTATYVSPPAIQSTNTYDSTRDLMVSNYEWVPPTGTKVTAPIGGNRDISTVVINGKTYLASQSQPAGSGCVASTNSQTYDANGNVNQRDDFNGTRVCYAYDLSRSLEASRVEGLATSATCSTVTPVIATLPTGSRKVSTEWHPDWALQTKVAEPGKLTTSVYNGQPDPFNGNAIASCAPVAALLPDGKPITVLCKQVEQATTDTDGHLGFSAALQSTVANRTSSWTYNQWGQVLTEDGPRTDINDVTTYTYYSDTTADHLPGDLQSVTNAAGKVTSYSKYNKHGQLLESTDPNGVLTVNTYDLRQRLLSSTVGGQTTSYAYDPAGQLKKVTLPDASWIGYDYDAAHRQVAVYDHKGNRTEYQLDNAGNRTGETTKDPNGALKRQLTRSIDALGRVQQTTGRE